MSCSVWLVFIQISGWFIVKNQAQDTYKFCVLKSDVRCDGNLREFEQHIGIANPLNGIDIGEHGSLAIRDMDNDGDLDLIVSSFDRSWNEKPLVERNKLQFLENTGSTSVPSFTNRGIIAGTFVVKANPYYTTYSGTWGNVAEMWMVSSPSLADIDNDGDFDLFIASYNYLLYFENIGDANAMSFVERTGDDNPLDDFAWIAHASKHQIFKTEMFYITMEDIDGDSDVDVILGSLNGQLDYLENIGSKSNAVFTRRTGIQNPFNVIDVGVLSSPQFYDYDFDGDLDLFIGESGGTILFFENVGSKTNPTFTQRHGATNPTGNVMTYVGVNAGIRTNAAFGDMNGDGQIDMCKLFLSAVSLSFHIRPYYII